MNPKSTHRTTRRAVLQSGLCGAAGWGLVSSARKAQADEPAGTRFEFSEVRLGADFKLTFYAPDEAVANRAKDEAYARVGALEKTLTEYDETSELMRLCATAGSGEARAVSPDLWFMLQESKRVWEETGGAFDCTVGPLMRQWRRARRLKELPSAARLAEARAAFGSKHLILNETARSARLELPGMSITFAAIGPGWIADEARRVLAKHGITRALVEASGDFSIGQGPPGTAGWTLSIAALGAERAPTARLLVQNCGVATSGDAYQFVEIDGVRYSHIVDPATGLGVTHRTAVTMVGPDGLSADAYATAASVMGVDRGLPFVEARPSLAAMFVRPEGDTIDVTRSGRFVRFVYPEP